jgi:hypothetical protein
MYTAEECGRLAYAMPPDQQEEFKKTQVKKREAWVKARRLFLTSTLHTCSQKEKELQVDIAKRGNIPEQTIRESLRRAYIGIFILILCMVGEFIFAHWTIEHFGLAIWEAYIVAGAIVLLSIEAMDFYLTSLRKIYPNLENYFFLMLGCMGFVIIILLIYYLADIRGGLYQITSLLTSNDSLEQTVNAAHDFNKTHRQDFVLVMVALTAAFTIIGGVIYHDIKNRIPFSISYLRVYQGLTKTRNEMNSISEQLSFLESEVPHFIADFEASLAKERLRREAEKEHQDKGESVPFNESGNSRNLKKYIGPILVSPIILALCAFLILFLMKGRAHGAEHIIWLDISVSVGVNDYSGQETEFNKNVNALEPYIRNQLCRGDALKIMAITETSFSRPYVLLEVQVSDKKGSFGEILAREKLKILTKFKGLKLEAKAKATDIFGAVSLSAILFLPNSENKNLIFLSDMRQCTDEFNLEKPKRVDSEGVLAKLEKIELIPNLKGVKVWCLGVHTAGKSPAYWMDLKRFWTLYFNRAGAKLQTFSVERRFHYE